MATGGNGAPRTYVYPVFVTVDLRPGIGEPAMRDAIGQEVAAALRRVPGAGAADVMEGVPEELGQRMIEQVGAMIPPPSSQQIGEEEEMP